MDFSTWLPQLNIRTADVAASSAWLQQYGWRVLAQGDKHYRWQQLTDGQWRVLLQDGDLPALDFFVPDLDAVAAHLKAVGLSYSTRHAYGSRYVQTVSPEGLRIQWVRFTPVAIPADMPPAFGPWYGLSLLTITPDRSLAWWQKLGLNITYTQPANNAWGLSAGNVQIGLYLRDACPHTFDGPTPVYFLDAPERDAQVKAWVAAGHPLHEVVEMGGIQYAVLRGPEGQDWFLF